MRASRRIKQTEGSLSMKKMADRSVYATISPCFGLQKIYKPTRFPSENVCVAAPTGIF